MRTSLLSLAFLLVASGSAVAAPSTPAQRAKALVTAQLAAMADGDADALAATFTADAVVLAPRMEPTVASAGLGDLATELLGGSPHTDMTKGTIRKLTVGGTADAIVVVAEVGLAYYGQEPEYPAERGTTVVHVTELLVDAGGTWKVVAAAFEPLDASDWPSADPAAAIPGATTPGPLAPLLASPTALAATLGTEPGVSVLGTGKTERAIGPAKAKKLLTSWRKLNLRLDGAPREVVTTGYAFVQANVSLISTKDDLIRYRALLIAVPAAAGGWKVAAAQYVSR